MPTVMRNPSTNELVTVENPQALLEQGYTIPTDEELDQGHRTLTYGTTGAQTQAQLERVGRGLTLGQFQGVGSEEEIRAREEVSRELSPVTSFAADLAPGVAVAAATGGLGAAAGLGRVGALVAGELGGGAVQASQEAFSEGRQYAHDDIGRDVENTLLWTGAGVALAAAPLVRQAYRAKNAAKAAVATAEELAETAAAAEARATRSAIPEAAAAPEAAVTGEAAAVAPLVPDAATGQAGAAAAAPAPAPAAPVTLEGKTLESLSALPIEGDDVARVEALKADPTFSTTGRVSSNDGAAGITLVDDGGDLMLRDGRHRLVAAQELGLDSVHGRYVDGASGKVIFEGDIPLRAPSVPVEPRIPGAAAEAEVAAKEAADDGLARAVRNASKADADDIVERALSGAAEAPNPEKRSLFRDRDLYQNREAILDTATREMQGDLGKAVRDIRVLTESPIDRVSKNVSDNLGAQRTSARTVAENAATWSGQLKAEARAGAQAEGKKGLRYATAEQKRWTLELMDHAQEIGKAKTGKEIFAATNALHDAAFALKAKLEGVAAKSPAQTKLLSQLDEFSGSVRRGLEDGKTWGQAGEALAAHHQTFTDRLLPSLDQFEKDGWGNRVRALLDQPTPEARAQVGQMLDAMTASAESRLKYGSDHAKSKALIAQVDKIRRTMGLADEVADATGRMQTVGKIADVLPFVGSGVKGVITGDLGTAFRRLTQATDAAVGKSVDDWIRSSKVRGGSRIPKWVRLPEMSAQKKALLDSAKRRGITLTMARFLGDDESPSQAFERRRAALLDDEGFFDRVNGDFQGLRESSPEAFMLTSGKLAEAKQFLTARMPANVAVSVARPGGYPPSREAIEDWAVYWNAIEQPIEIAKNISGMRVQEAEAIQKIYPRLWEQMQATVLEKIGQSQSTKEPLDDSLMFKLDLLFDFDGAGSSAFSQRAANLARSAAAPEASGGGSSKQGTGGKRLAPSDPGLTGATMGVQG